MKIQSHEIAMQSEHSFSREEISTSLSFSTVCLEIEAQKNLKNLNVEEIEKVELPDRFNSHENDNFKSIYKLLQSLINKLIQRHSDKFEEIDEMQQQPQATVYHHTSLVQSYQEEEQLSFSTIGQIKTDNGTLDIDMNFSMKRSFAVENRIDIYSLFDPLVVNLDGDIPNLTQDSFSFDLDNDGKSDQISTLGSNSGFLAFDRNNDGIINQGSELFGTLTGDGFGELSEYDKDKNGWIDENDTIFDKLQIWLKNGDSNEKELVGLGEVGIGAIFLNSQKSEFTFKTETNQTLGEMKSCGMFLNENGTCGTISQIDFASRSLETQSHHEKKETTHKDGLMKLLQA